MVVLDATMLMLFFRPDAPGPRDASGNPLPHARQRVENLIAELDKSGTKIAIPTPALSEILVRADPTDAQRIVEIINRKAVFRIEPFDQRAAIEVAVMVREELGSGRVKTDTETHAKLKYDRQIVAIANVCGASAIYSDDEHVHELAAKVDILAYRVSDLQLPPDQIQTNLLDELEESAGAQIEAPEEPVDEPEEPPGAPG